MSDNPRLVTFEPVNTTSAITTRTLRFGPEIYGDVSRVWRAPLEAEGFGKAGLISGKYVSDVSGELDSLYDALRIASFARTSVYDKDCRRAFLAEYAAPYFTKTTLERSIIPIDSFIPRIIRNVSMLYKTGAERWLAGEDGQVSTEDVAYQDVIGEAKIDRAMKSAMRVLKLHNWCLVRPVVRPVRGVARMQYDVMRPDSFRVLIDEYGDLKKVLYHRLMDVDDVTQDAVVVWTPEAHYARDVNGTRIELTEDGSNPYGVVPFVLMSLSDDALYDGAADDLVGANLYANYLELLENTDATFSAMNIFIHTNLGLSQNEVLSPRQLYGANKQKQGEGEPLAPDGKFVSSTPNSDMLRGLKEAKERQASMREGMSPAMLSEQSREMSGKALKAMLFELLERRMDDAQVMEDNEQALYEMTALVANVERRAGKYKMSSELPEDGEYFHIDFGEQTFDDDPKIAYDLMMQKVKDGVLSIVDVYRAENPDVDDDDDVVERILKNKAMLTRVQKSGARASFLDSLITDATPADGTTDTNVAGNANTQGAANTNLATPPTPPNTPADVVDKLIA